MKFKHVAVSLAIAATALSAQAFAGNPEHNDWVQDGYAKATSAGVAAFGAVAPLAQLDTTKRAGQPGTNGASVSVSNSADASARIFPNLDRISQ